MSIIISNIILPPDAGDEAAIEAARAKIAGYTAKKAEIRRRSVDARKKGEVKLCYSVELFLLDAKQEKAAAEACPDAVYRELKEEEAQVVLKKRPVLSPVIVGFGPAGMFAALTLARAGACPTVLERGQPVDRRARDVGFFWEKGILNKESNVQFGEGGAGTFSDGKLTTGIKNPLCESVLLELVKHGADERILTQARPHIGTDVLQKIVKSIREEIIALGGKIFFDTRLDSLDIKNGRLEGCYAGGAFTAADRLVLAIGHSARDTFEMLCEQGIHIEQKAFSAGVRIEQLQSKVDEAIYGRMAGHPALPPAEYKLSKRKGERGVYSFCMCPGGYIVAAASEEGGVVTNGMSFSGRDGKNANAAIAVSVLPSDLESSHPLEGCRFQRRLERAAFSAGGGGFIAPAQNVFDFMRDRPSKRLFAVRPTYSPGVALCNLSDILLPFMTDMLKVGFASFDSRSPGFCRDGLLTGVETRTSSPIRITRGEDGCAPVAKGLYPCGEGAGYAGGIMSSACDGIAAARRIIASYGA